MVTVEWIITYVRAASRVLEVGAGDGATMCFLAKQFGDKQFIACEQNAKQLRRLREHIERQRLNNVTVSESNFAENVERDTFDLIYCVDVLEHVRDDLAFLRKIRDALRPGGHVFLHVPVPGIDVFEDKDHVRPGYEQNDLAALLETAGFRVERMKYTFGRRGLEYHHSKRKMSHLRRAIVHLLDMADSEKVRSEIGVIATRVG